MSRQIDPREFVDALLPVVRQCAQASLIFYGRVADLGKAADTTLTALDGALQEIILSVVLQRYPEIRCIAEENTPLKRRFQGNRSDYALILDPIDGTLHFQRGDAPYHLSVGLCRNGLMEAAIVARPDEGKFFTAIRGKGAWVQTGKRRPRRLGLPRTPRTKAAFVSSKARSYQALLRPALKPREHPIGAALVLTLLAEGELCAYLTRQVEVYDVGPPSLMAEEAGARCFLKGGRVPAYTRKGKFSLYMAAADTRIEQLLHEAVRAGERTP